MLSRRDFMAGLGGAAALALRGLPGLMVAPWSSRALALESDVVLDTYNGIAAMLWPGNDSYSVAQGEASEGAGAVAANVGAQTIVTLDRFLPAPDNLAANDQNVPVSGLIAAVVNATALSIDPLAVNGIFLSPFARLSFPNKVATWRQLEENTQAIAQRDPTFSAGVIQYVFGALPALVQALAFTEWNVFDQQTRTLRQRPVGWDHTGYLGDALVMPDGWDEFKGYYQNRREVED